MGAITDERIKDLVSQIRINLKQESTEQLGDKEIFRKLDRVQRKLMRELKCVEKEFQIDFIVNVEEYDFIDEKNLDIKVVIPSWEGELIYKPVTDFFNYATDGDTTPLYWTIFNHKVYFRPYPQALDNVKILALQTDVINKVDGDIPPETPEYCDEALILGVCAEYEPEKYKADFIYELESLRKNVHTKFIGKPRERKYSSL